MRRVLLTGMVGVALLTAASAQAAGGPVPAQQGGDGASAPGSAASVVAVPLGGGRTLVEQVLRRGGVARTLELKGRYGVPGAAYDGSTTGLSADGRTAVLAQVLDRFPVHRSRFVVIDARRMRVLQRFTLQGLVTVDAIAPDGGRLYLIRYRDQAGLSYEVRSYDLARRRLDARPVIDPREADEKMQGVPMTRATSADGRWAYTLYMRPDGAPFIHALDTAGRTAACIDVPALEGADLSGAKLVAPAAGRPLRVLTPAMPEVAVDVAARTAKAADAPLPAPAPAKPAPPAAAGASSEGGAPIDLLASLAAIALLGLGVAWLVVARRRGSATA
jgi:hypothetical protein